MKRVIRTIYHSDGSKTLVYDNGSREIHLPSIQIDGRLPDQEPENVGVRATGNSARGTNRDTSFIQQHGSQTGVGATTPSQTIGTRGLRQDNTPHSTPLSDLLDPVADNYSIITGESQTGPARSSPGVRLSRVVDRGLDLSSPGQAELAYALSDSTSFFTRGVIHGIQSEASRYSVEAILQGIESSLHGPNAGTGIAVGIGLSVYEEYVDQIKLVQWLLELTPDELNALNSTAYSVVSGLMGAEHKVLAHDFGAALGASQTHEVIAALTGSAPAWYRNLPDWVKISAPWRSIAFGRLIGPLVLTLFSLVGTAASAGSASPSLGLRAWFAASSTARRFVAVLRRLIPARVRRLAQSAFAKLEVILRRGSHVPHAQQAPDLNSPRAPVAAPSAQNVPDLHNTQNSSSLSSSQSFSNQHLETHGPTTTHSTNEASGRSPLLLAARNFTPQELRMLRQWDPPARPGVMQEFFTRYHKLSLDSDTINEVGMNLRFTRRSGGVFTESRGAAGEYRALERLHRSQSVVEVRFVAKTNIRGENRPDMRIRLRDGTVIDGSVLDGTMLDVEIASATGARRGARARPRRPRGSTTPDSNPIALQTANRMRRPITREDVVAAFYRKLDSRQVSNGVIAVVVQGPVDGGLELSAQQTRNLRQKLLQQTSVRELWLFLPNGEARLIAQNRSSTVFQLVFPQASSP